MVARRFEQGYRRCSRRFDTMPSSPMRDAATSNLSGSGKSSEKRNAWSQHVAAFVQRQWPQITTVEMHKVKGPSADAVSAAEHQLAEIGLAHVITGDKLSVENNGAHVQLAERIAD